MIKRIIFAIADRIDPMRVRYYVAPKKNFVYIVIPGKLASDETFRKNFPGAYRVIVWYFDYLHFVKKVQLVTYADNETINEIQSINGNTDQL